MLLATLTVTSLGAAEGPNPRQALESAFPGCVVERRTVFLKPEQMEEIAQRSGSPLPHARVHPYVARRNGEVVGVGYFDTHRVRTLPETVLVTVDREGRVLRVEVARFDEPEEYRPREVWYRQFDGRALDPELTLGRGIDGVTGATLTARATTAAVRRVLALHQVLAPEILAAAPDGSPEGESGDRR